MAAILLLIPCPAVVRPLLPPAPAGPKLWRTKGNSSSQFTKVQKLPPTSSDPGGHCPLLPQIKYILAQYPWGKNHIFKEFPILRFISISYTYNLNKRPALPFVDQRLMIATAIF